VKGRIKFNIPILIRCFLDRHPFVKKHAIHFVIMFVLLVGLIGTIIYYRTFLWGQEVTTTSISFFKVSENDFRVSDDSFMMIGYVPGKDDILDCYLRFEHLSGAEVGLFNIIYDGEMKKETMGGFESLSRGVTETFCRKANDYTVCHYKVDFRAEEEPLFNERFSCNLFSDKRGEVRLNLELGHQDNLCNNIHVFFAGLDDINLEYVFPSPELQCPHYIEYLYEGHWGFLDTIVIRGKNPYIQTKLQETQFWFGVAIAILASSLAALAIEIIKDAKTVRT